MRPSDFNSHAPGRVVKNLSGHFAFIPNPLPPKLKWNNSLVGAVAKAEQALGRLAGLGQKLPNPQRLVRMFLRREAELSSRIEQTHARIQTMLLFEHLPNVENDVPGVREVDNNFRLLEFAFQSLEQHSVSLSLLNRMHEILITGIDRPGLTPGKLRGMQNWIGHSRRIEDARYVPPPPHEVEECLRELVKYIRKLDDLPTVVRTAIVHYQFESLHPYVDGNGRVGRAIVLLMLYAEQVLPVPLLNPSAQLEQRRREYYNHLLDVSQQGEWETWIEFFCDCVTEEAEQTCARLVKLDAMRDRYRSQLSSARTSALLMKLIDELFAEPALTTREASKFLKINPASAQRLVDKLVASGILREVTGHKRNRVYIAQQIVDIFSNPESNSNDQRGESITNINATY